MNPQLCLARTAAIALALLAVEAGFAIHAGADGVPGVGTASTASTSPTPGPTPCPTDITGLICQATSSPTPTPTPTPSPSAPPANHAGSGTGGTSGSAPAPGAAALAPPPAAPGKTASVPSPAPSAATVSQVAATFRNAPFLGQLLTILEHPTSDQRPDLRHFRPSGGAGAGSAGTGGPGGVAAGVPGLASGLGGTGGSLAAAVAIGMLGVLLAMGVAVLVGYPEARIAVRRVAAAAWRLHPSLHRVVIALHNHLRAGARIRGDSPHASIRQRSPLGVRIRPTLHRVRTHLGLPHFAVRRHSQPGLAASAGIAALPALVIAAVLGSAAATHGAALAGASRSGVSAYFRGELGATDDAVQAATASAPAAWLRLVTIERGLVAQQDELAAQEAQIDRLVINLAGHDPDSEDSVAVGPDSTVQKRDTLASLVAAHAATEIAFQRSLQAEYDLYRAAAQDPAQRAQLTAAVAAQQPQVQQAVSYNLSLIQTQLAQEATIAQAEQQLSAIGSLTDTQLAAMRKHQAFIAPLVAEVTQVFGPTDFSLEPPLTYNGTFSPHFHTGIDLGAPLDTPVHAAADGVVLLAAASVDSNGKLVGYGNYVVVAHPDGFVTLYGHLDSIAVHAGQVVHQGDIVGLEGSTGWSTGPHVHFEIRHDGAFLDPAPYLAGQLPS